MGECGMRNLTDQQLKELSAGLDAGQELKDIKLSPSPNKKPRNNEETRTQRAVMKWWSWAHKVFHVDECLLHSVPNGGFRNVVTASIMKAEGQRRGVFDLKLNVARRGAHGLWLEMKSEKGVLSPEQIAFSDAVVKQGYMTAVAHSYQDAVQIICDYLTE